jgi:hypothetical protein
LPTCCGGALAFPAPEKSQAQIKKIVESAYDHATLAGSDRGAASPADAPQKTRVAGFLFYSFSARIPGHDDPA